MAVILLKMGAPLDASGPRSLSLSQAEDNGDGLAGRVCCNDGWLVWPYVCWRADRVAKEENDSIVLNDMLGKMCGVAGTVLQHYYPSNF